MLFTTRHRHTIMFRIKTMYNSQDNSSIHNCTIYNSSQTYDNVQNQDNVHCTTLSRQTQHAHNYNMYNSTQADAYTIMSLLYTLNSTHTRYLCNILTRNSTMSIRQGVHPIIQNISFIVECIETPFLILTVRMV